MSSPKTLFKKTCSECGQQKPISAFLELSSKQGTTTYGNICASCRKTRMEKHAADEESDEGSGSSSSGVKIDSKTKVREEIEKKLHHEQVEELYHEDRDKDEKLQDRQIQKTQTIAKQERRHRENFLNKFLVRPEKTKGVSAAPQEAPILEDKISKEREVRTDVPFIDTAIPKEKYGVIWRQFKERHGQGEKKPASKINAESQETAKEKEALIQFVEENWIGPSSKKR